MKKLFFSLLAIVMASTLAYAVTQDKVWRVPNGGTIPSWGPVNLDGGANAITGDLPTANIDDHAVTGIKINSNAVDDSTLEYFATSNHLRIKDLGVTTGKLADGAVTYPKRAALNYVYSSPSGTFTSSSATYVPVTNLIVTITTSGRPVLLSLITEPTAGAWLGCTISPSASSTRCNYAYFRCAGAGCTPNTQINTFQNTMTVSASALFEHRSGSNMVFFDYGVIGSPGTYRYQLQVNETAVAAGGTVSVEDVRLVAFEL